MRYLLSVAVAGLFLATSSWSGETPKQAPKIVLKSPDGKKEYDLAKLTAQGPVLVRLTCACTGCDAELPFFQKLQAAYDAKGLQTLAVFKEKAEDLDQYVTKNNVKFLWSADPKGEMWKTFDAKSMPTNILIDKGGKIVAVINGCKKDGQNAQTLSNTIADLLKVPAAQIVEKKNK